MPQMRYEASAPYLPPASEVVSQRDQATHSLVRGRNNLAENIATDEAFGTAFL